VIDDADRRRWAAAAERYGSGWAQANAPDLGWLVAAVRPSAADRAIDVGTGAGHAARALAPHVASVTAVDPTPEMLAVAERLTAEAGVAGISFTPGTAESLPAGDGSIEIAISRFSVHHWPDPGVGFRDIARVLRPGGRLAIVDMVAPEAGPLDTFVNAVEILRDPSHARSLRSSEWVALLDAAGFEARLEREWPIRHDTESWMAQTDPPEWRRDAVRRLLREAPAAVREALAIEPDSSAFSVGAGLIVGTLRA
jgi:SAM-dependent methyltransferase